MKKRYNCIKSAALALFLASIGTSSLHAFRPPEHAHSAMANYDKRSTGKKSAKNPEAVKALDLLQKQVEGLVVEFEPVVQSPRHISSSTGFLTGPNGEGVTVSKETAAAIAPNDPYRPVKAFLNEHAALFGHNADVLKEGVSIKRESTAPHNGVRSVVWQQQVDKIDVFEAVLIAHLTRDMELVSLSSQFVANSLQAANQGTPNRAALQVTPSVTVQQAIANAAANVGETTVAADVASKTKTETANDEYQTFSAPSLKGEVNVKKTWLPMAGDALRLCWQVIFTGTIQDAMFMSLVDVETGEVLVRRNLTHFASPFTYRVWTSDSPSPFSPGLPVPGPFQPPVIERTYLNPVINSNASPLGWVTATETLGNNVDAHLDRDKNDQPDLPRPAAVTNTFDFPIDLALEPATYGDGAVVQLFYWVNWYHDRLYELGFTEAAGNFQLNNFGRGGRGGDAVQADAQDGSGINNANFSTPPDGLPGRMQMYIFDGATPGRDGDFDAEVILHEATHGLSNRRVGGGVGISALQSGGMGEGWSDFYGLSLLSETNDNPNASYAAGGYLSFQLFGLVENYYFGIRRYPYSTDLLKNPLTFKDIDPSQALAHTGVPTSPFNTPFDPSGASEVHNAGEVWCVTLWDARANLIAKHGAAVGNQLMLQLVSDGMTYCPPNPNFLQARDGILMADRINNRGANSLDLWRAFAKRGMGGSATSPSSSTTQGVVEAFDMPGISFSRTLINDLLSGNGNNTIDNNECLDLSIVLVNNGARLASNIVATLTTTNQNVGISLSRATYAPMASGVSLTNLTPFKLSTSPNFQCGTPIDLVLEVKSDSETRILRFRLETGRPAPAITFSSVGEIPIPDFNFLGAVSPILVSGIEGALSKVTVSLHLTHTWVGDLKLQLIAPDNTVIVLADGVGGFGRNYGSNCAPESVRTIFDDKASLPIDAGRAPFVGSFRPVKPLSALMGKSGIAANGVWRLQVIDQGRLDVGTIRCWSLSLSPTLCTEGPGDCATDLALSTSVTNRQVVLNTNFTYALSVTNRGVNTASDISITNLLPANVRLVSATASVGVVSVSSNQVVVCRVNTLQPGSSAQLFITVNPLGLGSLTNIASVSTPILDKFPSNNSSTNVTVVGLPAPLLVAAGVKLISEGNQPFTGGIESGETVTLNLQLQNVGSAPATNLTATLLASGGVTAPSQPQLFGAIPLDGTAVGRNFSFTAANASSIVITLQLKDGLTDLGTVSYSYGLGATATLVNSSVIIIPELGQASTYPSIINVSGLLGSISKISVSLHNLSHSFPSDVDVLLVSPSGRKVKLMSDVGGGERLSGVNLTFSDSVATRLSASALLVSGTYHPTDFEANDLFPGFVDGGVTTNSLTDLTGSNPNGSWMLYVVDDNDGDGGRISGGWSLSISTVDAINPAADLAVWLAAQNSIVAAGSNVTYSVAVTNHGSSLAKAVVLSNALPVGFQVKSVTASQGSFTTNGNWLIFQLGSLGNGAQASALITGSISQPGLHTNQVVVTANELDVNLANNSATAVVTASAVADLAIAALPSAPAVETGSNLSLLLSITNGGPFSASAVVVSNRLPANVRLLRALSSQGSVQVAPDSVTASLQTLSSGAVATVELVFTSTDVITFTNIASVSSATLEPNLANNQVATVLNVQNSALRLVAAGARMTQEDGLPKNLVIDAGETVTLELSIKNLGTLNTANLVATLLPGEGFTAPNQSVSYGAVLAGGAALARPFTFTALSPRTAPIALTLQLRDGTKGLGQVVYTFGASSEVTFRNSATDGRVSIVENGPALTYPSAIEISNVVGVIRSVTITLTNLTHNFPDDLDILLVGPSGKAVVLMSDMGGNYGLNNVTLTFDDEAALSLADSDRISSGTYKPTDSLDSGGADLFPSPASAGPYAKTLATFKHGNPNGTWRLFVVDDTLGDDGLLGGWSLAITTEDPVNKDADLAVALSTNSLTLPVGSEFSYTITVTNRGQLPASGVTITNTLSASLGFVQGTNSQVSGSVVLTTVGNLDGGSSRSFELTLKTLQFGEASVLSEAGSLLSELTPADNRASLTVQVANPTRASFDGILRSTADSFSFTMHGTAGLQYVLEFTPSLVSPIQWTSVSTNLMPVSGTLEFQQSSQSGARFYRARQLP